MKDIFEAFQRSSDEPVWGAFWRCGRQGEFMFLCSLWVCLDRQLTFQLWGKSSHCVSRTNASYTPWPKSYQLSCCSSQITDIHEVSWLMFCSGLFQHVFLRRLSQLDRWTKQFCQLVRMYIFARKIKIYFGKLAALLACSTLCTPSVYCIEDMYALCNLKTLWVTWCYSWRYPAFYQRVKKKSFIWKISMCHSLGSAGLYSFINVQMDVGDSLPVRSSPAVPGRADAAIELWWHKWSDPGCPAESPPIHRWALCRWNSSALLFLQNSDVSMIKTHK